MSESLAPNRQVGRFTLTDLVEDRYGCQVWRGEDGALHREVALWLIPYDADLATDLHEATKTAATVDDRRIVPILDVLSTDEHIAVVTEWAQGEVLRDHLAEPLPAEEAARIAFEVAGALESAHARGIAHGRLRPSNVLIGHDGEVRVTGLGIDAVLAGVDPVAGDDPARADLHGIGSILYVGLTGRWPDGAVDGVPAAPQVAGHTPPPSRLVADIPEPLDELCSRTVLTIAPPRGRSAPTTAAQTRELLGATLTDLTGRRPTAAQARPPVGPPALARLALGLAILVAVIAVGWLGWRILGGSSAPVAAPGPDEGQSAPASGGPSGKPKVVSYRIVEGSDFDPLGNGEENSSRAPLAYDGDKNTAWRTVTYYNKSLDKPGVGFLVDLGAPRSIGRVVLHMVGNGTDLQVLTSNEAGGDPRDYDLMAQATEAGEKVTLKSPRPASARYVLVWMTGLPQVDGGWRGGIREIRVTN